MLDTLYSVPRYHTFCKPYLNSSGPAFTVIVTYKCNTSTQPHHNTNTHNTTHHHTQDTTHTHTHTDTHPHNHPTKYRQRHTAASLVFILTTWMPLPYFL